MAHKVHIGQQFDSFSTFENASVRYLVTRMLRVLSFHSIIVNTGDSSMSDVQHCEFILERISKQEETEREKQGEFLFTF